MAISRRDFLSCLALSASAPGRALARPFAPFADVEHLDAGETYCYRVAQASGPSAARAVAAGPAP